MTGIVPITTIAYVKPVGPSFIEASPAIAFVFDYLGIPITTATIILVMFAAWGVWHWVTLFSGAVSGLSNILKRLKGYLDKKPE
jgi:hypothetical protein